VYRLVKLLVPALVGMLGLLAVNATSARADARTSLPPMPGFHQMLVDESAGYLFLSEGTGAEQLMQDGPIPYDASGVVVTSLSGKYVTTLDAGNGVEGLALSADGKTLYAALSADGVVAAINVSSITPTTTLPTQTFWRLGAGEVPFDLAIQSGKLWVSFNPYQMGVSGLSQIGYFSLSAANPSFVVPSEITDVWYASPELAGDPNNTGILIASESQQDPAYVASYQVSGSKVITLAPEQRLVHNGYESCANEEDLAVVPGGSKVIMACGWPYAHYYYSTTNWSLLGDYATNTYPNAIAMAPSAGLIALGDGSSPSIYVYKLGGTNPLSVYNFGNDPTNPVTLADRGLALSPNGSVLYAVTTIGVGNTYSLNVFDNPAAGFTLIGPPTGTADTRMTLNGALTLPGGTPAGTTIKITRTEAGKTVTLPSATTTAGGAYSVSDTPGAAGTYTYTASYGARTVSATVNVVLMKSTLLLNCPSTISVHTTLTLHGALFFGAPAPAGITVTITRTGAGQTVTLPPATTAVGGAIAVSDKLKSAGSYTYTARFAGDAAHTPATASCTVTAS
jgi:hypothetical protein